MNSTARFGCDLDSRHDPGCAGCRHAAISRLPRPHGARAEKHRVFQIETPQAAAKLRELIALGGEAIEGPWTARRRSR